MPDPATRPAVTEAQTSTPAAPRNDNPVRDGFSFVRSDLEPIWGY